MRVSERSGRPKIAYFGDMSIKFIRRDHDLLSRHFRVGVLEPPRRVGGWPGYFARAIRLVRKSDVTFSWFAGWHSLPAVFLSRVYDRPSIVVGGGFDVVNLPEIDYGAWTNIKERYPARYCLGTADMVISVSRSNRRELLEKVRPNRNILVYNGVDPAEFPLSGAPKEKMAVTVGGINRMTLLRKGIEPFVRAARYLPDVPFYVVGRAHDGSVDYLRSIATPNVRFTGFVPDAELLRIMQRAKVYVQPSAHEGFGISVAEAMLCGCVPVVTKRFALPEVVGDTGFYVPFNDPEALAEGIGKALAVDDAFGLRARERVITNFSMKRREEGLLEAVKGTVRLVRRGRS